MKAATIIGFLLILLPIIGFAASGISDPTPGEQCDIGRCRSKKHLTGAT